MPVTATAIAIATLFALAQPVTNPVTGDPFNDAMQEGGNCFDELNYECAEVAYTRAAQLSETDGHNLRRIDALTALGLTHASQEKTGRAEDTFVEAYLLNRLQPLPFIELLDATGNPVSPKIRATLDRALVRARIERDRRIKAEQDRDRAARAAALRASIEDRPATAAPIIVIAPDRDAPTWRGTFALTGGIPVLVDSASDRFEPAINLELRGQARVFERLHVAAAFVGRTAAVNEAARDEEGRAPKDGRLWLLGGTVGVAYAFRVAPWFTPTLGAELGYAWFRVEGTARGPLLRFPIQTAFAIPSTPLRALVIVAPDFVFAGSRFGIAIPVSAGLEVVF